MKYCRELPELVMYEGLAAPGRSYPPREADFIEETAENPVVETREWYEYCRGFFGGSAEPFVPVTDTLEVMRLLEECRRSSACFME